MSNNSSSRPERRGYNSDVGSYLTPQVSSSLAALAGSGELSEKDLAELGSRYGIPPSVIIRRPKSTERANASSPGLRSIFVVALENGLCLPVHPYVGDVLSMAGIFPAQLTPNMCSFGFTSHSTSKGVLSRSTKHKADAIAFSTYWVNRHPMPMHFDSDHRVLRATFLSPGSDVDLGALEALRATLVMHDHAPPPPPAAPATSFDQLSLRPPTPIAADPVMVSSSLEEDEVESPLLRRYLRFPGLSPFADPFFASIFTRAACFRARHPIRESPMFGPSDAFLDPQGAEVNTSQVLMGNLSASPHPPLRQGVGLLLPTEQAPIATLGRAGGHSTTVLLDLEDQREVGSTTPQPPPSASSRSQRRLGKDSLPQSPAFPSQSSLASRRSPADQNHKELISSFSTLGDKLFDLQGVVLQSYKGLLSSYEEASGSSSRAGQLEHELKALRKEKAQEEGEYNTLQERYAARVRRTEAVKDELEGMQAERDSALLERDALKKEGENFRTGRDEMLQTK
ncbi:hypothetical protein LIER_28932 [Lithospermum erythrorhizon]|uniref:Uncharacterized protein n=1 Tax=Lithospermum erythrorhizon TaxID=34254 RepID=A0AAV3RHG6_LITER